MTVRPYVAVSTPTMRDSWYREMCEKREEHSEDAMTWEKRESENTTVDVAVDMKLANAIIDMDNISFDEGLGPDGDDQGRSEAWDNLVTIAERIANRTSYKTQWQQRRNL